MSIDLRVFGDVAERYGYSVAAEMLNVVANSANQAEAIRGVTKALNDAFNLLDDPVTARRADGFAVGIVAALERSFAANWRQADRVCVMARYRKIDPRIWNDEKLRILSDGGERAFSCLLTRPRLGAIGGAP